MLSQATLFYWEALGTTGLPHGNAGSPEMTVQSLAIVSIESTAHGYSLGRQAVDHDYLASHFRSQLDTPSLYQQTCTELKGSTSSCGLLFTAVHATAAQGQGCAQLTSLVKY